MMPIDSSKDVFLELFNSISRPPFEIFDPKNNQIIASVNRTDYEIHSLGIKKCFAWELTFHHF